MDKNREGSVGEKFPRPRTDALFPGFFGGIVCFSCHRGIFNHICVIEEDRKIIPLRDTIPSERRPVVNYAIIGINAFVFLIEVFAGSAQRDILYNFGVIPFRFVKLWHSSLLELFTPVTAMFLHGGWLHIISNMLYLYIFGDNVEDMLGHGRYIAFYLLCGFASFLAQVFINPASMVPNIGASGAVAGVLGAYFILFPGSRVVTLVPIFFFFTMIEVPAFFFIGFWFLMQLLGGTAQLGARNPFSGGIAFWAHIGGFLTGILLLKAFLPKWRIRRPGRRF